jgi:hypothetical protein
MLLEAVIAEVVSQTVKQVRGSLIQRRTVAAAMRIAAKEWRSAPTSDFTESAQSSTILSSIPGRLRLKVPASRRGDDANIRLCQHLLSENGICRVVLNPRIASLLVEYDEQRVSPARVRAAVELWAGDAQSASVERRGESFNVVTVSQPVSAGISERSVEQSASLSA